MDYEINEPRIDWSKVVTALQTQGLVKTRMTDHEYRKDPRNITWVKDLDLQDRQIGVGALQVHELNNLTGLAHHLLTLAGVRNGIVPDQFIAAPIAPPTGIAFVQPQ